VVLVDGAQPWIENTFRLHVMNMDERAHRYELSVTGLQDITLEDSSDLMVEATTARTIAVNVRVPKGAVSRGSHPILLKIQAVDQPGITRLEKAVFLPTIDERNRL
jgi:polyferredoxin